MDSMNIAKGSVHTISGKMFFVSGGWHKPVSMATDLLFAQNVERGPQSHPRSVARRHFSGDILSHQPMCFLNK